MSSGSLVGFCAVDKKAGWQRDLEEEGHIGPRHVSREVGRLWRPRSFTLGESPGPGLPDLHLAVDLEPRE